MLSILKTIATVIFLFVFMVASLIAMAAYTSTSDINHINGNSQSAIFIAKTLLISVLAYGCAFILRKRYPDTPNKDAIQTKQWYLFFYVVFSLFFIIPFILFIPLVKNVLGYLLSNYGKLSLLPFAALGIYLFIYGASRIWRCPSCNAKLHFLEEIGGIKVKSCHKCGVSFETT
jgi:hypothetical protein